MTTYTPYTPAIVNDSTNLLAAQLNYLEHNGIKTLHDEADAAAMPDIVVPYAGATVPYGWLACEGQAVSRTTYSRLYGILGTLYGTGDGINTFNLPDLRAYFVRGLDEGRGLDSGRSLGSAQADENLLHQHTYQEGPTSTSQIKDSSISKAVGQMAGTGDLSTSSVGSEFRPVNYAVIFIIKW